MSNNVNQILDVKTNETTNETTNKTTSETVNETTNETTNDTKYCIDSLKSQEFDYNYNLHIIEERYNILQFSNGLVDYLFPN